MQDTKIVLRYLVWSFNRILGVAADIVPTERPQNKLTSVTCLRFYCLNGNQVTEETKEEKKQLMLDPRFRPERGDARMRYLNVAADMCCWLVRSWSQYKLTHNAWREVNSQVVASPFRLLSSSSPTLFPPSHVTLFFFLFLLVKKESFL